MVIFSHSVPLISMVFICLLVVMFVIAIAWWYKRLGNHGSIITGVRVSASLVAYAWQDKKLLILALLKAALGLFLAVFGVGNGYRFLIYQHDVLSIKVLQVFLLIVLIVCYFFISNIFELMATHYIFARLENKPAGMQSSLHTAWDARWMLCKFTVLDVVMGTFFASKKGATERPAYGLNFFTGLFSVLAGLGWRVATYFIMPVLLEEKQSVIDAIKKSAYIMKDSFGQMVGFRIGKTALGIIGFFIACVPLLIVAGVAAFSRMPGKYFLVFVWVTLIFLVACMAIISIIATVMEWVFICIAYNYTQAKSTGPFDKHFIQQAVETK